MVRRSWVFVAIALLVAACGTTVPNAASRLAAGQGSSEFGPSASGTNGPAGGQGPGGGSGLPGAGGTTGVPGGTTGAFGGGTGGTGATFTAPGLTATTLYVGADYQTDQGTANGNAFGAGSLNSGDARVYYDAVIKQINAQGGIAGRKVVPIYAQLKVTSTSSIDSQFQSACDKWTHDNKVFVILDGGRPVVEECAKKAGAAEISEVTASVPETFRQYPNYVEVSGLNLVRMGHVTVDPLAGQGYFDRGARIGIVTWDDPNHRQEVNTGFIPALARLGLSLAVPPYYVHVPQSEQDLGGTSAGVSSAVLRFNSKNVDHVLILDGTAGLCAGGCLTTLFLREAQSQQYHPRYGFNENNTPVSGYTDGLYPKQQLHRAVAVLWDDSLPAYDAGTHSNAARNRCYALMKANGIPLTNSNAQIDALAACGELWFLQAAVARISGPLTVASFIGGVNVLRGTFNDPTTYATRFDATQHDGLAAVRNARFDDGCSCWRYSTGPYAV